jgi:hypothetical protein
MSAGIDRKAVTPRNRINKANTKKVYGQRSAKRTIPMSGSLGAPQGVAIGDAVVRMTYC